MSPVYQRPCLPRAPEQADTVENRCHMGSIPPAILGYMVLWLATRNRHHQVSQEARAYILPLVFCSHRVCSVAPCVGRIAGGRSMSIASISDAYVG
jgi:hypothetical protein